MKICRLICMMTVLILGLTLPASAAMADTDQTVSALLEAGGGEDLMDALPQETKDAMEEAGLSVSPESILNFSIRDLLSAIGEEIKERSKQPIRLFAIVCAVVLLAALLGRLEESEGQNGCRQAYRLVSVLTVSAVLIRPLWTLIVKVVETVTQGSNFLLSFIPVFSAVLTTGGKPASALTYHAVLFSAVQVLSQVAVHTLLPLLQIYLAFCMVGGVEPMLHLDGAAQTIRKTANWIIGLGLTLFVGLLSLQGMVANAADTLATRTARFVISSAVPVVGGAVSEAFTSLQSCLGVVRSAVGSFGALACIFLFLPTVLSLLLYLLILQGAVLLGDLLGVERVTGLCRAAVTVLTMLLGILICFSLFVIVATTMMILLATGG